jgi:hypothetical protein
LNNIFIKTLGFYLLLIVNSFTCAAQLKEEIVLSNSTDDTTLFFEPAVSVIDFVLMNKINCILENSTEENCNLVDVDGDFKLIYSLHKNDTVLSCLELINFKSRPNSKILAKN